MCLLRPRRRVRGLGLVAEYGFFYRLGTDAARTWRSMHTAGRYDPAWGDVAAGIMQLYAEVGGQRGGSAAAHWLMRPCPRSAPTDP